MSTTPVKIPAIGFSEADWEGVAKERLGELDWKPMNGQDIAPGTGERDAWNELLIRPRLLGALQKFNPTVPLQYLQQAAAEIASPKSTDPMAENHRIHGYLVDGYRLSYIDTDGLEANPTIRLLSPDPDQMKGGPKAFLNAVTGAVNYLRSPATPFASPEEETLAAAYRRLSGQLSRAWALCSGATAMAPLLPEVKMYEEIRVWMAKFDANDRQASGEPVPEDIQRLLGELIASATSSGEILDIYEAAGMPKPSLDDLTPEFIAKTQKARNPQLAIEALRKLISEESVATTRNNVIRQRAFSERITELMKKYANQQLTSAEVIAELVELAREVAAEGNRGARFTPPLNSDELAFYDAVASNESAVEVQGEGKLAEIARQLVNVMRRDVRTDWIVRDDVRAPLFDQTAPGP